MASASTSRAVSACCEGDLAHAAMLGALEQHVLVNVRHAQLFVALVGAAGFDPDLKRDDWREVVLADQDAHPVVECVEGRCFVSG
jgi:hypothetical protein